MDDILDGLEETHDGNYIDYKKDNTLYFYHSLIANSVYFNNILIWRKIKYNFGCRHQEISEVIKYILEKHLNKKIKLTHYYMALT